ncbi:MAG TPA: DUF5668 domain-containing protein [Candidatus Desulfaltia sp.]|nr:DUF5668 domain-containing protein [Candidatus Desulfaltia sp.]
MAKKQRSALAWGIILIVIGLLFILENFGVDAWANLFRLWPLILIAWGAWKLYFGIKERKEGTSLPKPEQD